MKALYCINSGLFDTIEAFIFSLDPFRNKIVRILVQMRTRKFAFKIYWPIEFHSIFLSKKDFLKIINLYSVILPLLLLDFLLMTPYSQFTIQFCLTIWIPLVTNSPFWSGNVVPMLSMPHWLYIKKWPRYLYIYYTLH